MKRERGGSRSFRSRVALRVFLLCAVCSLVPTIAISLVVYTRIAAAEEKSARERLQDTAKRYGVILQDRLYSAEQALIEAAERKMRGQPAGDPYGSSGRIVSLSVTPQDDIQTPRRHNQHHPEGAEVSNESLYIVRRDGQPTAQINMTVRNPPEATMEVSGVLQPGFLWQADMVETAGVQICVVSANQQLACVGEAAGDEEVLTESWELYLKPHYGRPSWFISAVQPRRLSEASLASVRKGFPMLAGVSLLVALLIGSFEVRRTHGPLADLMSAFHRMARGRFTRLKLRSNHDEYYSIGRAFNQLSRTLRRQFRLLATFERMDQAILERPAIDELVAAMLPKLPQMLGCERVALVLSPAVGSDSRVIACHGVQSDETLKSREVADVTAALAILEQQWPQLHWSETPVKVAGTERGRLLCGRRSARAVPAVQLRQIKGVARRFAVALRNEEREQLLVKQAYYDELTQLPNRRLLQDRVQQALREADTTGEQVAFLYLDLDRFKTLNDSLGHRSGDELLTQLAHRLSDTIGATNTVARLGGDEFMILLRQTNATATASMAERVLHRISETVLISGVVIAPQASIGVALHPLDGRDFDTLLRNADAAMYRGKAAGGGRVVFFEEQMNQQALRRLRVEAGLRKAIAAGKLQLHYQPKVSLPDGSLHGVEALMRWTDDELGVVGPAEFVSVAEESGLIHDLGALALTQALAFCRRCMDADVPIGHVAVNVSMLQLRNAELADFLQQQLLALRVPPGMLQIEVTESSIMQDADMVSAVLARMRALGVRIAIDDFGTGYSSLAVLQQLSVDVLKIDRAFVMRIAEDAQSLELVRAMLAVGRALGLAAVAEGVETPAQAELLARDGCEFAQGYLYGKAMPEEAIVALARRGAVLADGQPWIMSA